MDLFKEVLAKILEKEEIEIVSPNLKFSAVEMVDIESFKPEIPENYTYVLFSQSPILSAFYS